jgi:hypothetical protein
MREGGQRRQVGQIVLGLLDVTRMRRGERGGVRQVVEHHHRRLGDEPCDGLDHAIGRPGVDLGHVVNGVVVDDADVGAREAARHVLLYVLASGDELRQFAKRIVAHATVHCEMSTRTIAEYGVASPAFARHDALEEERTFPGYGPKGRVRGNRCNPVDDDGLLVRRDHVPRYTLALARGRLGAVRAEKAPNGVGLAPAGVTAKLGRRTPGAADGMASTLGPWTLASLGELFRQRQHPSLYYSAAMAPRKRL